MKKSNLVRAMLVLWCVGLSVSFAQQTNTLESLRQSFEKQEQSLLVRYGKSIDMGLADMRKAGDLNGVLAMGEEKRRFEVDNVVPVVSNGVLKVIGDSRLVYQYSVVSLMRKYVSVLDGIEKDMVKQYKDAEANDAKEEKKRVSFELADIESKLPKAGPAQAVTRSRIPEGAKEFKGHYYIKMDDKLTWHDAKSRCEDMGGHLVAISSKEENTFVKALTSGGKDMLWIGLTSEKGGRFQWIDGKAISFSDWDKGQPFPVKGADFAAISNAAKGWSSGDDGSVVVTGYVCEWDSKDVK